MQFAFFAFGAAQELDTRANAIALLRRTAPPREKRVL